MAVCSSVGLDHLLHFVLHFLFVQHSQSVMFSPFLFSFSLVYNKATARCLISRVEKQVRCTLGPLLFLVYYFCSMLKGAWEAVRIIVLVFSTESCKGKVKENGHVSYKTFD